MEDRQSFLDLRIDEDASVQLTETSRWAKLFAILVLSFIGLAALVLVAALVWGQDQSLSGNAIDPMDTRNVNMLRLIIGLVAAIVLVIVVILMIFLLKAAQSIRSGIQRKDGALLNLGLGHLRNYFTMMGVLTVLLLVISIFGFLLR